MGHSQEFLRPHSQTLGTRKLNLRRASALLCHENEAPFPEALAEHFIRSYCPPGGLVLDPMCGSGTTGAVSVRWGRRFHGCDVRAEQVELSRERISRVRWAEALREAS
jgi:hypothetical protein